ncbi:MAG: Nitrogen permease regulator 2 [Peltula sp. TS41687]|nr:MAG: Nitrogen permease regulator 2 [Peltula sp. TS41687]
MIKSLFCSQFNPREGPKVIHQVPDGSIVPSPTSTQAPLVDFDSISSFVIPRQAFCDRLVSICNNRYRVLGHPVCINSRKYVRNQFIFNFSIVLEEDEDMSSYVTVVRRLAILFRSLEEQEEFLSKDILDGDVDDDDGGDDGDDHQRMDGGENGLMMGGGGAGRWQQQGKGRVYALCEIILEDLNNYCECMIPIDMLDTINIKLFPLYSPPTSVKAWHAPLSTVRLESVMDENWDLTMLKIVPFINGINSVRRIAELAEADFILVKKCMEHLLYYGCLIMLDIFQFSAIYAPTPEISTFIEDRTMQQECASYISTIEPPLAPSVIISLYTSLRQGQTLKAWCMEHKRSILGLDIRRFITFGLIKGFLYRIHKYAIKTSGGGKGGAKARLLVGKTRPRLLMDGSSPSPATVGMAGRKAKPPSGRLRLMKYLDGMHCFDEICTEMHMSEKQLLAQLRAYGDVQIIHR